MDEQRTGPASASAEAPHTRRSPMRREVRTVLGTLAVGFLGVIVTLSIGFYSENRADRRAVLVDESAALRSRFEEASRDRAQIRDAIEALRQTMLAGFEAAAQDRAAIRDEAARDRAAMLAGFEAAAQDRAAIRDEAAQDRAAIRDEATRDRAAIRDEATRDRAAIRDEAAQDRAAIRDAVRDQGDEISRTLLFAALCLIDVVRHQNRAGAPAADVDASFTSASCDRLERRANDVR